MPSAIREVSWVSDKNGVDPVEKEMPENSPCLMNKQP